MSASISPLYFLRQGLSLKLEHNRLSGQPVSACDPLVSAFPVVQPFPAFYMCAVDPGSGPPSLTDLSSQPFVAGGSGSRKAGI